MSTNAKTANKQLPDFIPELWSDKLNKKLEKSGIGMKIVNRRWEGEIKNKGDTVNIQRIGDVTVRDYDRANPLTYEDVTGDSLKLVIDQEKYFAFKIEDISKVQSSPDLMDKFIEEAKKSVDLVKDTFIISKFTDIPAPNLIGTSAAPITITPENVYGYCVDLVTKLMDNNAIQSKDNEIYETSSKVGEAMPYLVINPAFYGVLLKSPEFIHPTDAGDKVLRKGSIGSIAGLDVLMTTNVPVTEGVVTVMAGINDAITFAGQVAKIESTRDKDYFGDFVKGLYVYGAKTVIPNALAGLYAKVK